MKTALLDTHGDKTFVLIFDKGDEVVGMLTTFAKREKLDGSHLSAIGGFNDVTLAYFDRERKDYKSISVKEQVEVVSLLGNIALDGNEPKIHAHVVVGRSDGTLLGGHLLKAHVWPTLEVVLRESPPHLVRVWDRESGLALIHIDDAQYRAE
jgi:uncharacterized protein